ncbi:MAG: 30S ribosomal protein S20 [Planctomycetota bacterium]|nr:MAG: 30S ribosomal protein S20 [Planctomycetota bacterium]
MPNTQQAKKRLRQNAKRRQINRSRKTAIKTFTRKTLKAIEEGKLEEAQANFVQTQKRLDKAAKGSTIHPNKAARRKSRLQKRLNALQAKPSS